MFLGLCRFGNTEARAYAKTHNRDTTLSFTDDPLLRRNQPRLMKWLVVVDKGIGN